MAAQACAQTTPGRRVFPLQGWRIFATFAAVRPVILFGLLALSGSLPVHAQEQEKKLLDRLLKPDTSLQNSAQDKQFQARGATTTKAVRTKSFHVTQRKSEKGFWNTQQVSVKEFATRSSRETDAKADLSTRYSGPDLNARSSTKAYSQVREASDANKSISATEYAGNRPFLGRGKSQKALSVQDKPLTIEQVRELLNKNK